MVLLPSQKLVHFMDVVHPEMLFPYFDLGVYDVRGMREGLEQLLGLEWHYLNGGHANVGSRRDVEALQDYLDALEADTLAALSKAPFLMEGTILERIGAQHKAVQATVREALRPRYGKVPSFDAVTDSHVLRMIEYVTLY